MVGIPLPCLFLGDNDGGENQLVDSNDSTLWDHRIDLNGTHSNGLVSLSLNGLQKNATYYYRLFGGNSVHSGVWSLPSQEGLSSWWSFDETTGSQALDSVGSRNATLVGSPSQTVFLAKSVGLSRLNGSGERVSAKGFQRDRRGKASFVGLMA